MMSAGTFPFKLDDLVSWTVRRTDGAVTKFSLTTIEVSKASEPTKSVGAAVSSGAKVGWGLASYCSHVPKTPVFCVDAVDRATKTPLALYVGSVSSKSVKDTFDFIVDCGNVLTAWDLPDRTLEGDGELVKALSPHITSVPSVRVLKVDWFDRMAPKLDPAFWPALNAQLHGDVMTCCQGGHGRSGTSFVCLLLCNAPDYDALDAIIHLRAVHCARAIESQVQHEYINEVAKHLGRKANAMELGEVHDYKGAFMAMTKPTAIATKKMLGWDK